ncbi:ABC transporter permease [Paraburkholderia sp. J12]|uniref:ABC transporter permease n=1 Tax=Paraburkholderia sp. J12 TaxID=2805432 RepID=UPI002ABE507C|nr:ABC transporter permease [Paraburkholderia sp. J12]
MTGKQLKASDFANALETQLRVLWALVLREIVTRYGRENIGILWFFVEPLMFILGIVLLWSVFEHRLISTGSVAEFALVSYPTILMWRNTTGRVTKAIEVNRPLLHHRPIRPMDFFYSRIILEFASVTTTFLIIFVAFVVFGIAHPPRDLLAMIFGWLMIGWFSFGFVLVMGALSEMNDVIDKISHVILYFMLPVSGAFIPTAIIPAGLRDYLLLFPLVDCVEYFRYGYYGDAMKTYFDLPYTIVANLFLTFFALSLMVVAIRRIETS